MPQLNPAPWLTIFLVSWAVLITMSVIKTSKLQPIKPPTPKPLKLCMNPWAWPWL